MPVAEKISVTMTSDMVSAIRESVSAGEYVSTSEALRDAVRLWRDRRSIDDPPPSLTEEEVDGRLNALFDETTPLAPDAAQVTCW